MSLQEISKKTKKFAKINSENITLNILKEVANVNSVHISIILLPIKIKNKIDSRSFLIGPNVEILYKYDRIHMYDFNLPNFESYKESASYSPGSSGIIKKMTLNRVNKIEMTICYDVFSQNYFKI